MARPTHQWFSNTFGFEERGYAETRLQFAVSELTDPTGRKAYNLTSKPIAKDFYVGPFEMPRVKDLHSKAAGGETLGLGPLTFENISGNVTVLHLDEKNEGAVFQVASQFNCLEMVGPHFRPEDGITRYSSDLTQGPACALCCPAATVYRNYFVNETGQAGQHQLDLLEDIAILLDNAGNGYWHMQNGYCLPTNAQSIRQVGEKLADTGLRQQALEGLRVGVHWNTEVSGGTANHRVCQVFCSALPIAYARHAPPQDWQPFAALVLEGAYDATLAVAVVLAKERKQRVKVFLTALGGGAFGNPHPWIEAAIRKALERYRQQPLDVFLVHFGGAPKGYYENLRPVSPPSPL
eukprot:EG_transcript_7061